MARNSILVLVTLVFLAGCNFGPPAPKLIPVQGKITVQSKPLGYGRVVFKSANATNGPEPQGKIEASGSYTMLTNEQPGVAAGKYLVQVFSISPESEQDSTKPPVWGANQKYAGANSGLTVEVSESTTPDKYQFDLEP